MVHRLGEAASRALLAILIKDVDLNGPFFHRKALIDGRLVTVRLGQLSHLLDSVFLREGGGGFRLHVVLLCDNLDLALSSLHRINSRSRPLPSILLDPTHLNNHLVVLAVLVEDQDLLDVGVCSGGANATSVGTNCGFSCRRPSSEIVSLDRKKTKSKYVGFRSKKSRRLVSVHAAGSRPSSCAADSQSPPRAKSSSSKLLGIDGTKRKNPSQKNRRCLQTDMRLGKQKEIGQWLGWRRERKRAGNRRQASRRASSPTPPKLMRDD